MLRLISYYLLLLNVSMNFLSAHNKVNDEMHRSLTTVQRNKRTIFLRNSGVGYFVALALPATPNLVDRHVFVAFNFEANYGLPYNDTVSLQELHAQYSKRSVSDGGNDDVKSKIIVQKQQDNETDAIHKSTLDKRKRRKRNRISKNEKNGMFTRKRLYKVLERELFKSGFNGTSCLLKTICETSQVPLYENNGVLGNIVHILFTPSSSEDENLPFEFYAAENYGLNDDCKIYEPHCPRSILDFITTLL